LILWATMWALGTIGFASGLMIFMLLTWWAFEAGALWMMLMFLGLVVVLASLSLKRKWRQT
jgi:hypothetical protein